MNILESLFQATDPPTALPHIGEVYGIWFYYVLCTSALSFCQMSINHTEDPELREAISDLAHDLEVPQIKKIAAFFTKEGVAFPLEMPRHPQAVPAEIPPGARMHDLEIANLHAMKLQALMATCAANMQDTVRDDIGAMWVALHTQLVATSLKHKKLMQKRGWLIMPPPYAPASVSH